MMANKNYQEFVPSSRPISRTPSESAQSEVDGKSYVAYIRLKFSLSDQYRANRYIHPNRRPMIMGYNPVPLQYQRYGPKVNTFIHFTLFNYDYVCLLHLAVTTNISPPAHLSGVPTKPHPNGKLILVQFCCLKILKLFIKYKIN